MIGHPTVYALSLAVYCTAWTFYGSVGRATATGLGFLTIYLGPTLMALLWGSLLVKMVRISKSQRITSIADFIASRYGMSQLLGGLVTVIAVVGVVPYIALQLKAIAWSFTILLHYPQVRMPAALDLPFWQDTAFIVALLLAAFTMLFGTRHLDASERHEGMVAAIAFESIVKLVAFLAVGLWVTLGLLGLGRTRTCPRPSATPRVTALLDPAITSPANWFAISLLAALAVMLLPRQFQVAVVENSDERQIRRAIWLFPLYLLLINLFVIPIALAGLLAFPEGTGGPGHLRPDPAHRLPAALAGAGGLHRRALGGHRDGHRRDHRPLDHGQQRPGPAGPAAPLATPPPGRGPGPAPAGHPPRPPSSLILLLGYLYYRLAGEAYALVAIGLISFAAVAQFAPAGDRRPLLARRDPGGGPGGALGGLSGVDLYPAAALLRQVRLAARRCSSTQAPSASTLLKPQALFGLTGWNEIAHCLFWSLTANILRLSDRLVPALAQCRGGGPGQRLCGRLQARRARPGWPSGAAAPRSRS